MINDRLGVLDLEAAGGVGAGRWINMESRPLCCHSSGRSYWRRKVTTPLRGGGWGVRLPSLRCHQEGGEQQDATGLGESPS